ncbi:MAG: hypothetical protein ACFFE6_03755 [Candidatus Thorarchaeota archaeon]
MNNQTHPWMCTQIMHENEGLQEKYELKWTAISDLTTESRDVNVKFKILEKESSRRVIARNTGRSHLVCNCLVGDATAVISLTLWNEDIDLVDISKTYALVNGRINIYDECMNLGMGRWGEIREVEQEFVTINQEFNMSRPFMGIPHRRRKVRSQTGRTFSGTAGRESRGYPARKSF